MSHTDVHHDPAHAFMPYPAVPVPHAPTGPLAGLGRNPNIAAVLLVGLEESSTEEVARRIRSTGKPVERVHLQPDGTVACIADGTRKAAQLSLAASRARRVPCPVSSLVTMR